MAEVRHRCRIYLQFPTQSAARLEAQLAQAIDNSDTACVLLHPGTPSIDDSHISRLIDLVQSRGLACLIAGDVDLAERLGADGVHITADSALYAEARRRLGESASIGVACGLGRHEAMQLAERGADYIAFEAGGSSDIDVINQYTEIIAWWSEIFVVPCVAWNVERADDAAKLAAIGADFVAPSLKIWRDAAGPRLIGEIDTALRRARRPA
jgi:thiamine-phosphate pyrophosphorylase